MPNGFRFARKTLRDCSAEAWDDSAGTSGSPCCHANWTQECPACLCRRTLNEREKPDNWKSNEKRDDPGDDRRRAFLSAIDVTQAIADEPSRATVSEHHRYQRDEKRNHTEHGLLL